MTYKISSHKVRPLIGVAFASMLAVTLPGCETLQSKNMPDVSKIVKKLNLPSPPQLNELPPFVQIIELIQKRQTLSAEKRARRDYLATFPITHPERKAEFDVLWGHLQSATVSYPVSDKRLRVKADATLFSNQDITEQNFFIRAAAETLKAGHDGFVVVHLDYYKPAPNIGSLIPDMNFSSRRWIGNYEDFLDNKNEQNMFSSRGQVRRKALDGVILMIDDEDYPNRDRFSANEIYFNLLDAKDNPYR